METPEEFVARDDVRFDLDGECRKVDADAIRARDNAVRLALLDEIREHVAASYPYGGEWPRRYEALLTHLAAKYTEPTKP